MENRTYIPQENRELLEQAEKEARSVGAKNEPSGPEYIGAVTNEYDTFHYYKDEKGNFYYESNGVLKLQKEMKESQLKKHPQNKQNIKKWYPESLQRTLKKNELH